MNTQPDLTESQKIYLPVVEARENRDKALDAWRAASDAYLENMTHPNQAAMMAASRVYEQAEKQYQSVHIPIKHNRNTVDGSDTSMTGSLRDAGYDGGVM